MGVLNEQHYLLDVFRCRLEYPDLRRAVKEQYVKHSPNAVVIEDKGSGIQLLQDLRADGVFALKAYCPPPGNDKAMRLFAQSAAFENGCVWLPKQAPWLADYVRELTTFPGRNMTTRSIRRHRLSTTYATTIALIFGRAWGEWELNPPTLWRELLRQPGSRQRPLQPASRTK
ncbi:phage terminase large subunit [Tunturiibacter gelidiferens]|uniref:phage terminase large subunit n=1 Tax=Tunturiibacter gelidiferens TaxID=3069689 RepID=UPI003D9BBA6B